MSPNVIELQPGQSMSDAVQESIKKGSIADVFLNSLNITQIYEKRQTLIDAGQEADKTPAWIRTIVIAFMGGAMMITTGLSFLFASLVFIIRLAVLIFLLGFSPIWFAAYIIPDLKEYANKGAEALKGQLLIMPIYLLLMYFALRVVGETNFTGRTLEAASGQTFWESFLGLIGNYAFVIIMLNIPLLAALKLGLDNKGLKKLGSSLGAGAIWQKFGSMAGSRTIGRAAYSLNQSGAVKWASSRSPLVGALTNKTLSSVSSAGFGGGKKAGYSERLKAQKKAQEGLHKQLGSVERADYETDAEFKKAQDKAREYQATYRQNLPWKNMKGQVGGVIGFMVDNRANRESAAKLNKSAADEATKKSEKDNKKKMEKLKNDLAELNKESSLILPGKLGATVEEEKRKKREEIQKEMDELQEKIDKAEELKEEERNQKILNKLDELEKKGGDSGGGGGGGDKKDDKKK
jgi:predicted transcriptional regulator